ncbi:MAG: rRNA pseudouridine synthase [Alphaproteobacteria bacterium]|nr:rRNA pseudouridine synthase [Alphaproteobacteria bacterium]MCL2889709.1 rRNA pseudouridine synthase [Alphaproteobacteria bacterium]
MVKVRIAKFIADNGFASRREAERLVESGAISVNGIVIDTPVFFIEENDKVTINGKQILRFQTPDSRLPTVIAFHKPINTMTTARDPNGRETVYDALPAKYKNFKYVGRLDYKTTGLLLITNDGALARELTLPLAGIKRTYVAKLRAANVADIKSPSRARALRDFLSPLSADDAIFDPLRRGVTIDGVKYAPMEIELISRYPLSVKIVLREGKKNEIRIAFDYIGLPVSKLRRESYGPIQLGDLPIGKYRELSEKEVLSLQAGSV